MLDIQYKNLTPTIQRNDVYIYIYYMYIIELFTHIIST